MDQPPTLYLAGPMVFYPDADAVFARMKAICAAHGLLGDAPVDGEPLAHGLNPGEKAAEIRRRNIAKIRGCDGVVACLTPFRGPGADGGTCWEMGYAEALGKPVVGWTDDPSDYATRVPGAGVDDRGMAIEDFGRCDNLMMTAGPIPVLASFEAAVIWIAKGLAPKPE